MSFASQSAVTDPGELAWMLGDLPDDLASLAGVARGLVIHYRAESPLDHGIPRSRLSEIDTRHAEAMLRRLRELQDGSLAAARPPERRLVGCCRDFTVLLLTMARAKGIAARSRVGFAGYFVDGLWIDHEVAEVWDEPAGRWRLVDAQLIGRRIETFDPLDVPRDRFLVAGTAWRLCRAGEADPDTFQVGPDVPDPSTRGWPYLQHNLVLDLAALARVETLLWDAWGLAEGPTQDPEDLALLDEVAAVSSAEDPAPQALARLSADPRLRVPAVVRSYDPLGGPPRQATV